MKKVISNIKVQELPFLGTLRGLPREDKVEWGLITSTGGKNEYRMAFVMGQGGSYKEETWNCKKHWHNCCKSKVAWRHKSACPGLVISE